MHELSIVETLIEQVVKEIDRSGHDGKVVQLDIVIGRLSGVNVDSIRFAFELLSPDTALENAKLCIAEPKAICRCQACGARTEVDELVTGCPKCGDGQITYEGGQELLLDSIELEDSD